MDYYLRAYIGHLIRELSKDREIALLPALRGGQIRSLEELKSLLELVNWDKRRLSLYMNISKLREIPHFTFDLRKRSESTHEWFTNEFNNSVYETDLFFDFDKDKEESWEDLIADVKKLKEFLDSYEVPYQLMFSGNKGFQVIIDGRYMPKGEVEEGNIFPHKIVVENIKEALNLDFLDLANNGLVQRLRKIPYSIVIPKDVEKAGTQDMFNEQIMKVALPLSDEQLNNFKVEDMILCNVLKKVSVMRRGTLERFSNLNDETKKNNVLKFIKEFDFK